ncbi:MAG: ribosome maturation factor RimP [Coriobacteriales bacterium]|nr:ribosome maturation factor RimP [Coriobacteriales bacterium]
MVTRLIDLLEPEAEKHGFELVTVEQAGGRRTPVIRVLLDREEGIDLEAITAANRWVSELLDAADPIGGPYTLEVSSPGIDRPLRKLSDFDRFAGETVSVKTRGHGGRNAWTGTLVGTSGEDVLLDVNGEELRVSFGDIAKARIKGVVDFSSRKGGDQ